MVTRSIPFTSIPPTRNSPSHPVLGDGLPTPFELAEAKPEVVAEHAKTLVEQWFSGRLRTAVLTDASGKWCGGTVIEPGEITSQLRAAAHSMRYFHPKQIEVQTSAKREWRSYPVEPEWAKCRRSRRVNYPG